MSHRTMPRFTRRSIATVAVAVASMLVLAACSSPATTPGDPGAEDDVPELGEATLTDYGLDGMDAREIIDYLDAMAIVERPDDLMASIRPSALTLTSGSQNETTLPMPDDLFYVSIAPYEEQTHECYFHSLTTCTGELQNADVEVLVTDASSGEVLVDETRTSFDNGFVGMWLPRGIDVNVELEYDGLSAATELTTSGGDAATCVTTMQLT
ncbi:CueP family metal-binding protein [Demequina aurantiaca]|uniref:CueP family metal-binding protein n=1 Tax=Demequina aurantiaca TaxID=676200 RepID=UPI003D33BA86